MCDSYVRLRGAFSFREQGAVTACVLIIFVIGNWRQFLPCILRKQRSRGKTMQICKAVVSISRDEWWVWRRSSDLSILEI